MNKIEKTPVEKVAADKATIEKEAAEKNAGFGIGNIISADTLANAGRAVGTGLAVAGAMGLANTVVDALRVAKDRPAMARSFEKALEMNQRLKSMPREQLEAYFGLVAEASPTVAKNPLLLSNYLQYLIDHEGSINFMGYKQLVDLESQVRENRVNASPVTSAGTRAIFEGVTKGITDPGGGKKGGGTTVNVSYPSRSTTTPGPGNSTHTRFYP